ncbi:MAG: uracil phosphoribosyltransferase [Bacteroidales bacterium]|nr:uracil phosphoribosyltransferase [Bacteroidales bacterium]
MVINLGATNSLFNEYIAEIRDQNVQKDRLRFRRNMERLGEIFAYEISKKMDFQPQEVVSPLGISQINRLEKQPVLATILRAGLPLHNGFLNYFDKADNAFISAYRKHNKDGSFKIKLEYVSCPDLNDKVLILADPMLATGASLVLAFKSLLQYGKPKDIHFVTAIACTDGINYLKRHLSLEKFTLWVGAIDEELTAQSYIVPGLGDAGDLAFGSKMNGEV